MWVRITFCCICKNTLFISIRNIDIDIWRNLNHRKQVLRRRDGGKNKPCNENYQQDDNYIRYEIVRREGCIPPHWRQHFLTNPDFDIKDIRDCKNQKEMRKVQTPSPSFVHSEFLFQFTFPCHSIFYISLKKEQNKDHELGL